MPDAAVGMVVQTRVEWECLGQKDLTVWHWNVQQVDPATELFSWLRVGIAGNLLIPGGPVDSLSELHSNQIKCTGVVAQVIHPVRYHGVRVAANIPGEVMEPVGTNNLALSVGYAGVLAGRGRSGRTQVPGLPQKWVVDGYWDAAVAVPVYDILKPFRTELWNIALGSTRLEPILFNPGTAGKNKIIDASLYTTVRTMHRRTVGVGE